MADASNNDDTLNGEAALARPYARAIFELARAAGDYRSWAESLALLAVVVSDDAMRNLLDNPRLTRNDAAQLVIRVCAEDIGEAEKNLVVMLAENDRLAQLPMIAALYNDFRDEAEGLVEAEVISAQPLSEAQKSAIAEVLKQRLGRDIQLNCSVNEDLVGGAVIRAGDLVIDGSAVEHLRQLHSALVH